MWTTFDSRSRRHMWVEFAVGFYPVFPLPIKQQSNISKFQFDLESEGHRFVSGNRLVTPII